MTVPKLIGIIYTLFITLFFPLFTSVHV
uniref:Uncharacterized protein n=1 Tax=Rhizophora mucronata TaxID=61149 RepID=A0A2P2IZS3_RHIMU